ncbi:BMC domain-containing protein [Acetomicrobium thermoterrenum DSM 13490]|uniref:BMC domain-containing protein n=1 Tax=Acetomicrobium thermoterrenum DSM 13490 TaxID=1120987 RepID=A0A1H3GBL5_9BACT|nr:BMC domain-containing protein [Acetomicrobium thermoterrenum]SDY00713.1 BMC domain-containing protein [Acetomicrobium thermoterrenum DSM 13490]
MQDIKLALGFIETIGLVAAVAAADAALKAANITLIGRENSQGGMMTVKIAGDVSAVKAALSAAKAASEGVNRVWSIDVIPRPGRGIGETLAYNKATLGSEEWLDSLLPSKKAEKSEPIVSDERETEDEADRTTPPKHDEELKAEATEVEEDFIKPEQDRRKRSSKTSSKKTQKRGSRNVNVNNKGGEAHDSGSPGNDRN